jgi:hypothetical protein
VTLLSTMNYGRLRYLMLHISQFRSGLLSLMTTSGASMFSKVARFPLTNAETKMYLNPVRDMGIYKSGIRQMLADDCTCTGL